MRSFLFLFKEFIHSISQNRFLLFTYGAQAAVSLLVLGVFFVMLVGAAIFWTKLGDALDVHAYLEDGVSSIEINQMEENFKAIPHVTAVEFRSKEDALAIFSKRHTTIRLDELQMENPLPASFVLQVDRPSNIREVAATVEGVSGIMTVRYGEQILDRYLRLLSVFIAICIVTMVLLVVFTYSSINNIIGLSIYARRAEIRIMQLVGATWWFIRWPFIFEGLFFGLVGALSATLAMALLLAMLSEALQIAQISAVLPSTGISSDVLLWYMAALLLTLGAAVGVIGSLKTVNTFLSRELAPVLNAQRLRQGLR